MERADSMEKTLMLVEIEGKKRMGGRAWDGWMASPTPGDSEGQGSLDTTEQLDDDNKRGLR